MASIHRRETSRGTRWDVRARVHGRPTSKTFTRKRDAEAYSRILEADKLRGLLVDPRGGRTPFAEVADRWLVSRPSKRDSSLARDKGVIDTWLNPVFGDRPVGSITRADVQRLVDSWHDKLAPSTISRDYGCLRALMNFAEADELITRSPCRGIKLPKIPAVHRPELDADDLERLADALGGDYAAMAWCGAVLGLRWAEVAGLTADSITADNGTVTISQQLDRHLKLVTPKSEAGRRTLAVPKWLMVELAALGEHRPPDGLLFTTTRGKPLRYSQWRRDVWVPATELAGLPGTTFHDLRSVAASALVAEGVDIKTAQTRLGHSNPSVTLALYARMTKQADRDAADRVGERFRPRDDRATEIADAEGPMPPPGTTRRDMD